MTEWRNPKRRFDVFVAASSAGMLSYRALPFDSFVAACLARLLPYRKKALIFGPQVCEFAAVISMRKAAFFLGGSLGLVNSSAVEQLLVERYGLEGWQGISGVTISSYELFGEVWKVSSPKSLQSDRSSYEALFPEVSKIPPAHAPQLLSQLECIDLISRRVWDGLVWGVALPEVMLSMLQTWISQGGKLQLLELGGLKLQDTLLLTSVEDAYAAARSMYEAWTGP